MTITLTSKELDEIFEEAQQSDRSVANLEVDEQLHKIPHWLGEGSHQEIDLSSELCLCLSNFEYWDDVLVKYPINEHTLHFVVFLTGKTGENHAQHGEGNTLICGGGIQREGVCETKKGQRIIGVNVQISHELFANFFARENEQANPWLQKLINENDWQTQFFPRTTLAIQGVAHQIFNCPFHGGTKKIYLQGKVFELIALQLASILENTSKKQTPPRLKPDTIARIHHAGDILSHRLEHPPSLLELAEIVGVSGRTLRRGFRELFGTTVFNYLLQKRMEKAEKLLREGNYTVTEVANLVGYSHLGLFASVFKRQYGISPRECIVGKKFLSR